MRAIGQDGTGGPDALRWDEAPDPVPGPGEVLVAVRAAGVNRADLLQREGRYPVPDGASPVLGMECSGHVAALGPGATGDWRIGDAVCALLTGGGYAELVVVPVGQLLPVPAGVDVVAAAGLPEAACTVWSNLVAAARLQPGEVLLVHGGASGIGTMAIQVAAALGARVACTAGTPAKLARCRELGAEITVSYRDEDFVEVVRSATGGRGADVVLDVMGASYLGRNLDVLAPDGRLVVIGLQGGARAELDLGRLLTRRATVHGTTLRSRDAAAKAAIVAGVAAEVWPLIEAGRVVPVLDRTFALADAAAAHRYLEQGEHVGKVLLVRA